MTRILAFSDIHNNVDCVRVLRAQEANRYDAVLIAGDIGSESFDEILDIVCTFECPVFYVYGNWDNTLEYKPFHDPRAQLVHHSVHEIGDLVVTGFSGCPTHWGQNPIYKEKMAEVRSAYSTIRSEAKALREQASAEYAVAKTSIDADLEKALADIEAKAKDRRKTAYKNKVYSTQQKADRATNTAYNRSYRELDRLYASKPYKSYQLARKETRKSVLGLNRAELDTIMDDLRGRPSIVITHERLFRFVDRGHDPILHLFGHRHLYKHTEFKGVHNVNIAALDIKRTASLQSDPETGKSYSANVGGYSVFEIIDRDVHVERRQLLVDESTWKVWNFNSNKAEFTPGAVAFASAQSPYL